MLLCAQYRAITHHVEAHGSTSFRVSAADQGNERFEICMKAARSCIASNNPEQAAGSACSYQILLALLTLLPITGRSTEGLSRCTAWCCRWFVCSKATGDSNALPRSRREKFCMPGQRRQPTAWMCTVAKTRHP